MSLFPEPPKPSNIPLNEDELVLACMDVLQALDTYEPYEPLNLSTQTVLHLPQVIVFMRGLVSFYGVYKDAAEATRRFLGPRL